MGLAKATTANWMAIRDGVAISSHEIKEKHSIDTKLLPSAASLIESFTLEVASVFFRLSDEHVVFVVVKIEI